MFVAEGGKHSRNTASLNRPISINSEGRQGHFWIKNAQTFFFVQSVIRPDVNTSPHTSWFTAKLFPSTGVFP